MKNNYLLIVLTSLVVLSCRRGQTSNPLMDMLTIDFLMGGSMLGSINGSGGGGGPGPGGGFNMVSVPAKTTFIGWDDSQAAGVSAYLIAETEITYELWNAVRTWANSNGYSFANAGEKGDGRMDNTNLHPVTLINRRDAMVWCNALTEYHNVQNGTSLAVVYTLDGATPIRSSVDGSYSASLNPVNGGFDNPVINPNAKGYRLPTAEEWELAARYINDANGDGDIMDAGEYYPGSYASGATAAYTDAVATGNVAWYSVNSSTNTHPVGTKTANALGLFDMSGNVMEWGT